MRSLVDGDDVISRAEGLDLMFEFLGALAPAVEENNRTTASMPYIVNRNTIGRDKARGGSEQTRFGDRRSGKSRGRVSARG